MGVENTMNGKTGENVNGCLSLLKTSKDVEKKLNVVKKIKNLRYSVKILTYVSFLPLFANLHRYL